MDEIDGVPLAKLVLNDVEWTIERAKHVEHRAQRKGSDEYEPRVEHATQACQDAGR